MPLRRTLHQVRCYLPWFLLIHVPIRIIYIALAAATCLRSLAGFGFPLFAPAMFNKLGYGNGSTILACLAIILGCPAYVHLIFLSCFHTHFFFPKKKAPLFFGNMVARYAWVVNSPIKHYNVRLKTMLGTPAHKHNYVAKENVACLHR